MKKVLAVAAFAALSSMSAFGASWTGVIADEKCAGKHADASEASMACAQKCVKGGAAPVFVTADNKVLKFSDDSKSKIMDHVGHKVTITGKEDKGVITVDSVKM
jgi:hypothetical protein